MARGRQPAQAPRASREALARYRSSHWGMEPDKVYVHEDPDLPAHLAMMGELRELAVFDPEDGPDAVSFLTFAAGAGDLLCFDTRKPERLYNVLAPDTEERLRTDLLRGSRHGLRRVPLSHLATFDARGWPRRNGWALRNGKPPRQLQHPYPRVQVYPVGIVDAVVYHTHKKGDGPSLYRHELGEESGVKPWLGVDDRGRLWWAGGNYTVPDPGITD